MGEDSSHAERCSVSSSSGPSSPLQPQGDRAELLTPSFGGSSAPSSPVGTLARMGFKLGPAGPAVGPASPGADRGQVSAITVVALLDKLVNMLDAVQDNQRRMESRQAELEGAVRLVQGDVSRLTKTHASTAGSVGKLLERSRKVGDGMKEVRERMDKQATAVKRLESNHHNLLKRNHFKVLIFQDWSHAGVRVAAIRRDFGYEKSRKTGVARGALTPRRSDLQLLELCRDYRTVHNLYVPPGVETPGRIVGKSAQKRGDGGRCERYSVRGM
ncbi:unnamed protein product [Merluccius merluccius]